MPLPIPVLVLAGLTALAGLAATRAKGKKTGAHPSGPTQEATLRHARLTLKEFVKRNLAPFSSTSVPSKPEVRTTSKRKIRPWLRIVNWLFLPLCALAFAVSFFYSNELLRILCVSGMIGFGTNWLAIKMLFHPRKKHILLGQGLIPKQREELMETIAAAVFRNLINEDIIREQLEKSGLVQKITSDFQDELHLLLEKPDFRADLRLLIETYLRDLCEEPEHRERITRSIRELLERLELGGIMGQIVSISRPFWKDAALEEIDKWIKRELPAVLNKNLDLLDQQLAKLPATIENESGAIERWLSGAIIYFVTRLDIRKTMFEQLATFDEEKVERLILEASNDQLGYITLLGGILGIMAGFGLWRPVALLWITAGTTLVVGLDLALTWLVRLNRRA